MYTSISGAHKVWLGTVSAVLCSGMLASLLLHPSFILTASGDLIQCFLLLSILFGVAANAYTTSGPLRAFWGLFTVGASLWFSSQLLWTYYEVVLRREVPNPFVGDVAIVLHLVPIVAALTLRPDKENQGFQLTSLDVILLFSWWLYLYGFFVIPWQYVSPDEHNYGANFDRIYFAGHFVTLLAAAYAWRKSSGSLRRIYGWILVASALYAVASIGASIAIDYGTYYTGSLYDVPLLISEALFTWMALLALRSRLAVKPSTSSTQSPHPWIKFLSLLATGTFPLLAAWAVFFSKAPAIVARYRLALTLAMIVFIGILRSIKQEKLDKALTRVTEELQEASVTDILTGVRNRRFLATTIESDSQQVLRLYSSSDVSVRNRDLIFYFIDIDHFKEVNDRFGHQQGDLLLVQIAARISSAIRHSDVLVRWGGEEFLVVSRFTDRDLAETLASRVLHAIGGEEFQLGCGSIRRTCSIGWAAFPWRQGEPDATSCDEVLRFADHALYHAKARGRNMAVGFMAGDTSVSARRAGLLLSDSTGDYPEEKLVTPGPQVNLQP